jgi:outer membrane protein TolC
MKIKIFFSLALTASLAQARVLTWQDCVRMVRENNSTLDAAEHNYKSTQVLETESAGKFYPQVSGSLSESQSNTANVTTAGSDSNRTYGAQINLSQNIFSGFADLSRLQQAKANTKVAEAELKATRAQVSSDLKQAYQALASSDDAVDLTQAILKRRQENLRMVDLRFQSGRENKGSLLLSKAYFQQAQYDHTQSLHQVEVAQDQLVFLLGLNRNEELKLSNAPGEQMPLLEPPLQKPDFEKAVLATPDYIQLQFKETSSKEDIAISKSSFFPSLDLTGSYGKTDSDFFPNREKWNAALTLTIPLFNGGRDWAATRSAAEKWAAASQNLSGAKAQILVTLKRAYQAYVEAVEKEKVDTSFREAQEVRADIARTKYNNGLMTFEDWDQVENDLISRQKTSLTSHQDRVAKEAAWEQAQGIGVLQ